ncbi:hypothetical protein C9J85_05445 [Haloferax sp. wsp5]|nr:hypothetical protein C9J85_05445 [Haloferax sp. wsp5]
MKPTSVTQDRYDVVSPEELAQQLDADETGGWDDHTPGKPRRRISRSHKPHSASMTRYTPVRC